MTAPAAASASAAPSVRLLRSASAATAALLVLLVLACATTEVQAVDRTLFRRCSDTGFCRRLRAGTPATPSGYAVLAESVNVANGLVRAQLSNGRTTLSLELESLGAGLLRAHITDPNPLHPRYEVADVLQSDATQTPMTVREHTQSFVTVMLGPYAVTLNFDPFTVVISGEHDEPLVTLNAARRFAFEVHQSALPSEGCDGCGEESWRAQADTKPRGPEAVGLDTVFHGAANLYGLPEHSTRMALKQTTGSGEPFRLYNLDVFEYELDQVMALYGAIPFVMAHSVEQTVGLYWNNAAETFIDVDTHDAPNQASTHWMSESGVVDVFVMMGPRPKDVLSQFTFLTGRPPMPQLFALGYHQSRWNYRDQQDFLAVNDGFNEHDIPMDVLWLDIEHTNGKRYFTWDKSLFPDPVDMQNRLAAYGRKTVTIIDPHIKRDTGYFVHDEATRLGMYVKNRDGSDYHGECWPGPSSWLDFFNPGVRLWWAKQFAHDKYDGSTPSLYTWNDMNEPSQFSGPEITMRKDAVHANGFEHRHVHNQYGFYQVMSTYTGHVMRSPGQNDRPFVLSRSFFAGSQRFGAVWTGDNAAQWSHLEYAQPMLLSMSLSGLTFVGADIGGFFGNPEAELVARWYQAAAFQPFFRGHAHIDTKRREPWIFGEPYTSVIRSAIRRRYALLPYWYTLWREAHETGVGPMRPLFFEFPSDVASFTIDNEFMLGSSLLVAPVTSAGKEELEVYLPGGAGTRWYLYERLSQLVVGGRVKVSTPLEHTPVFVRGGSIIPRRDRPRRSTSLMSRDPFTLLVALDAKGRATGSLYLDDGHSFDYATHKQMLRREFLFADSTLHCYEHPSGGSEKRFDAPVERILLSGVARTPTSIVVSTGGQPATACEWHEVEAGHVVVKRPPVTVGADWELRLRFE